MGRGDAGEACRLTRAAVEPGSPTARVRDPAGMATILAGYGTIVGDNMGDYRRTMRPDFPTRAAAYAGLGGA
jgi:hypothetical protein